MGEDMAWWLAGEMYDYTRKLSTKVVSKFGGLEKRKNNGEFGLLALGNF